MGIYLPNMEMPIDGNETIIRIQPDGTVLDQYGHHLVITAVPVPQHGRLGDLDALFDFVLNIYKNAQGDARKAYRDVLDTIVAAGDVISAEEERTMSILIKGMEMPKRCAECWLMDGEDSWCTACRGRHLCPEYRYGIKDRPDWCPLFPVPPHWDLIDRDALLEILKEYIDEYSDLDENGLHNLKWCAMMEAMDATKDAPTIIPAEEGQ